MLESSEQSQKQTLTKYLSGFRMVQIIYIYIVGANSKRHAFLGREFMRLSPPAVVAPAPSLHIPTISIHIHAPIGIGIRVYSRTF